MSRSSNTNQFHFTGDRILIQIIPGFLHPDQELEFIFRLTILLIKPAADESFCRIEDIFSLKFYFCGAFNTALLCVSIRLNIIGG